MINVSATPIFIFKHNLIEMASIEDSGLPQASSGLPHKVTLTNWERLNNAPLLLPGASAIQWNDYVFVLASDGTALLYQTKLKMWSMLPSCSSHLSDKVPLVNYQGQIMTVTNNSNIVAFDTNLSDWTDIAGPPGEINQIAVNDNTLYAYSRKRQLRSSFSYTRTTQTRKSYESRCTSFSLTTEGWTEHKKTTYAHRFKPIFTSEFFFEVSNKINRYKVEKTSEAESEDAPEEPPKEIADPPYQDYTLHVVKNTLFSFGGRDKDNQPTSDVLRYNPDTDTWESAGYMRSARYNVAVATMQQGKTTDVYVLGGELGSSKLVMKPKLNTTMQKRKKTEIYAKGGELSSKISTKTKCKREAVVAQEPSPPGDWNCLTSIIEKCTLFD